MSTKDNIDYIKEELSSEEKFLESFVKVERFYKKYKAVIITILIAIVVFLVWTTILNYLEEQSKIEANTAFNTLLENPEDKKALETLKVKNEKLYEIIVYTQAKKQGKIEEINVEYLKELSLYEKALKESNLEGISAIALNEKFLLKENAIFNKALLEAKEGKYKMAKETLSQIPQNSQINNMVVLLKHFLASK